MVQDEVAEAASVLPQKHIELNWLYLFKACFLPISNTKEQVTFSIVSLKFASTMLDSKIEWQIQDETLNS